MNRGRFLATLVTAPLGPPLGAWFARLLGVEVSSQACPPSPVTDEQIKDMCRVADSFCDSLRSYERDLLYGDGSMEPRGLLSDYSDFVYPLQEV